MSDGELVRQTLAGRTEAYAELVRRWAGRVTALCHAKVGRAGVAEDLAQEALLRAYRALASLKELERFGPWLCGIAQHICLDWRKARERSQVPFSVLGPDCKPEDFPSHQPSADAEAEHQDELRKLMAEVETLPEECREVLMLYYYQEVTYRELAGLLDVSAATINARLTRARALLRERLSPSWR